MESEIFIFRAIVSLIFGVVFFLVDLLTWQGIKVLLKNRPGLNKRHIAQLHYGSTAVIVIAFSVLFFFPQLETFKWPRFIFIIVTFNVLASKMVFSLFVISDKIILLVKKVGSLFTKTKEVKVNENRRKLLYMTGVTAAAAPFYILTRGVVKGAHDYRVRRETIHYPNLPPAFDGMTLAQISDIHSGSFFDKDAVRKGITMLNDTKPDLFVFTGDMVNNISAEMDNYIEMFSEIKAPMGRYSIVGNHDYGDYWSNWKDEEEKKTNFERLKGHHKELGWHLLMNEHVEIDHLGQKIGLIGVENWGEKGRFQKFGDIDKAREGMHQLPFNILLSHDPTHWDYKVLPNHKDIDLTLSGHTHGMQLGIDSKVFKWSPVQYMYDRWMGLYTVGNQRLYVNRGYGYLGFPGRVGILPEITLITLKKA